MSSTEMVPALATMTGKIREVVSARRTEAETGLGVAAIVSAYVGQETLLHPESEERLAVVENHGESSLTLTRTGTQLGGSGGLATAAGRHSSGDEHR